MVFNYHELMVGQPKPNIQEQRKFYLILSVLGLGVFLNAAINAGLFVPITFNNNNNESFFPGGEYIYQQRTKDYSASMGMIRRVASDLNIYHQSDKWDDLLYSLYLDEEKLVPAGKTRYMGGVLLPTMINTGNDINDDAREGGENGQEEGKDESPLLLLHQEWKNKLLTCHLEVEVEDEEKEEGRQRRQKYGDGVDTELINMPYEIGILPKVKAGIVQFPFTNGFISALLHSYKVMPAMIQYAKKKKKKKTNNSDGGGGKTPTVVLTTCSIKQQMCTHFIPLEEEEVFLLGRKDTISYANELNNAYYNSDGDGVGEEEPISMKNVVRGLKRVFNF